MFDLSWMFQRVVITAILLFFIGVLGLVAALSVPAIWIPVAMLVWATILLWSPL